MIKPKTMKAAILVRLKEPLVVDRVNLARELGWGQVLVKVQYTSICGSQIGEIDGVKGEDRFLPHLLGHEGSGAVMDVGPGVSRVKPGDHVVMHWRKGEGVDAAPPRYSWKDTPLNAGYITTFNEFAIVSENRLTPIPHDFDLELAPLFGCAVTTGLGVISNNANLKMGESVVVFGAGGVGLNMVQGASMTSAYPIIAVDLHDSRLEMALRFGATHTINASHTSPGEKIREILGSRGADVVIDNTGDTEVISLAYELTQPAGRTVLVGVPRAGQKASFYTLPLHFEKRITGSHGGESNPSVDIPRYMALYRAGRLKLDDFITDRFPLDDINLAIEMMRQGEIAGRCLIEMDESHSY